MSITLTHPGKGRQVTVPDDVAESYISQGWVVPGSPALAGADSAPSMSWKVDDLKAYAEERAIDIGDSTKKADILAVIEASSEEDEDAESDTDEAGTVPAGTVDGAAG